MTDEAPISVVLYGRDLMFRSRIHAEARAAGRRMTAASTPNELEEKLGAVESPLVLVDMDMPDAPEAIRVARGQASDATVVAYFSHVRDDLRTAAKEAGARAVMPRSQFVAQLPELLASDVG